MTPDPDPDTGPIPLVGRRPAPPPQARPRTRTELRTAPLPVQEPAPAEPSPPEPGTSQLEVPTSTTESVGPDLVQGPTKKPGRAGRDMVAAIGVGAGLGAVILSSLLVYRPAFLLVLLVAILVGVVELTRALQAGGVRAPLVPVLAGTVAMLALAWTRGASGLVVAFLLTVLAVLLWRLGDGPDGYLRDASAGVLVALYVPLLAGFCVLLLVPDDGAARVLAFIATVVGNDVGGFAAGVLFGKHPMAPSVSPKKSWEGMAGSVLGCVLVATPIVTLALGGPWWGGVLFGVALAVSATAGDLGESLIKRDLGIKDMGNLLPGHGGIMDRLDSLLPSAAVAYLLLSVVAPA
ncbi:phosphatidate cytidylyltransferase [Geodermatophilus obscurus]|uniref:Phosphatidate cytidylyltransferase n=1 Tax=Geodermatophilus obscurus (strain ATCC 25078 / DSM 43160 / JCM 3152 / CCUG 61914 / KCC A-0152 / KCTC 9177 / NBRC 13315 / NRRL B-3577 / G-20) TaxID=526225 RepID=D2SDY8_GEOOG|nr:phosphatidate cytidylyltransferase [Geodermatophilus obscurus]ADB76554.1 phosphatidate cytidylyltransferase [Geodermatophilus obscurus DSM 43160]